MLQALTFFIKYFSVIVSLIKSVEEAFPNAGFGQYKLEFIRQALEELDAGITQVWPTIAKLIGLLVTQFNAAKIFTTTTPAKLTAPSSNPAGNA